MINFGDVSLGYGGQAILSGLSFQLTEGDYLGLVGPNGAGKTTLLRALMGILKPVSGRISYDGGVSKLCFGYVPQRMTVDELFPLRVCDLVLMGRYPQLGVGHRPRAHDHQRVRECLERVGLKAKTNESFRDLSGGQKQRALMARALAQEPDILFLDEPTNGMDLGAQEDIMELIAQLHADGLTVVLVTHLLELVANHARTVGILHNGLTLGKVEDILTEEHLSAIYGRPVVVHEYGGRKMIVVGEEPKAFGGAR